MLNSNFVRMLSLTPPIFIAPFQNFNLLSYIIS